MIFEPKGIFIVFISLSLSIANSLPFKVSETKHTFALTSKVTLRDDLTTEKPNVQDNLIQSSEDEVKVNCENSKAYEPIGTKGDKRSSSDNSEQLVFYNSIPPIRKKLNPKNEFPKEKEHLSKFYRNGQREVSASDSIIFPPSSLNSEQKISHGRVSFNEQKDNYDNQHQHSSYTETPSIEPRNSMSSPVTRDQDDILKRIFSERASSSNAFVTHQQDQQTYDLLVQILRALVPRPREVIHEHKTVSWKSDRNNSKQEEIEETVEEGTTEGVVFDSTTNTPEDSAMVAGQVDFHSLYSGPKLKTTCPPGQHRTHNGVCEGGSRKLLNRG